MALRRQKTGYKCLERVLEAQANKQAKERMKSAEKRALMVETKPGRWKLDNQPTG